MKGIIRIPQYLKSKDTENLKSDTKKSTFLSVKQDQVVKTPHSSEAESTVSSMFKTWHKSAAPATTCSMSHTDSACCSNMEGCSYIPLWERSFGMQTPTSCGSGQFPPHVGRWQPIKWFHCNRCCQQVLFKQRQHQRAWRLAGSGISLPS